MAPDVIEKYVESEQVSGSPVSIFFKQRSTIKGIFIQDYDYKDMKQRNFWRIVPESKIEEWQKSHDNSLAKLFCGADFSKLK